MKIINFICFDFIFNMYPRPLQQCLSCFFPSLFVFYLSPSHKLYAIPIHIFLTLLKVTLSVTLFLLVFFFFFVFHFILAQKWQKFISFLHRIGLFPLIIRIIQRESEKLSTIIMNIIPKRFNSNIRTI